MKHLISSALIATVLLSSTGCNPNESKAPTGAKGRKVVVIKPMSHPSLDACIEGFKQGVREKYSDADIIEMSANGNFGDIPSITNQALATSPALIFIVTTPAASAAIKLTDKKVPLVYSAVTDPVGAGIISDFKQNSLWSTGVTDRYNVPLQCQFFIDVFPRGSKFAILYNPSEQNSTLLSRETESELTTLKKSATRYTVSQAVDIPQVVGKALREADAIIVNGDNMLTENLDSITKLCIAGKKPLFVGDPDSVRKGAIATVGPSYADIGRQAGLKAAEILSGKSVLEIPSENPRSFEYIVNAAAAKSMNIQIPNSVWDSRSIWSSSVSISK